MRATAVAIIVLFAFSCGQRTEETPTLAPAPVAYADFEFTDVDPSVTFAIRLTDAAKIEHARRVLSGKETARVHVSGIIVKQPADYNKPWSYHLESDSIDFFELAVEVCDSTIEHVEDHLDEVGGAYLPNNYWCPWSSKLTRELTD